MKQFGHSFSLKVQTRESAVTGLDSSEKVGVRLKYEKNY